MKRNALWLLSTITVLVLLFGYHTSTAGSLTSAPGTVVSSAAQPGRSTSTTGQSGSGGGNGDGAGGGSADGSTGGSGSGNGNGSGTGTGTGSGSGPGTAGDSRSATTTVTGAVAQTQWGPVQVQLTLQGGTITDVSVLQYPSGNPQDDQINAYALPILVQETVDAQSAQIDMVSGATVTSVGYVDSLQSALDQVGT